MARELALKALFQADVGKQPLPEVLDATLDQVRASVNKMVERAVADGQASIRGALESANETASDHTVRQLKIAARAASGVLGTLGERAGEVIRAAAAEAPQLSDVGALARMRELAVEADAELARIGTRPSFQPRLLEAVTGAGRAHLPAIEAAFEQNLEPAVQTARFLVSLVHGALGHSEEIDQRLSALAAHWSLARQAAVDRNILRLAAYELLYEPEIPPGATINEAVELAKKFSTEESGRFVNGVLGALVGNTPGRGEAAA